MIRKTILISSIFLLIYTKTMAADPIGTVVAVQGEVYATTDIGGKRLLKRRSEFYLHEMIETQKNGRAQLRLNDDTIISLRPNTRYAVRNFNLDKKNPKNNSYVGDLVEGILITMSSQGKNSTHSNHVLKTPAVTISIRGTLLEAGSKFDRTKIGQDEYLVGWVYTSSGITNVSGYNQSFDLDARNYTSNACIYRVKGYMTSDGIFHPMRTPTQADFTIRQISWQELNRTLATRGLSTSVRSDTSGRAGEALDRSSITINPENFGRLADQVAAVAEELDI